MFKRNIEKLRKKPTISNQLKQIFLTVEELDNDITTVLTTTNPYFDESCVEYNYKDRAYKPLDSKCSTVVFYSQTGTIIPKPPEIEKEESDADVVKVEELDTKRKNKFNFCDRATQTMTFLSKERETQTDPMPQFEYEVNVSPATIVSEYESREAGKNESDERKPCKMTRRSKKGVKTENFTQARKFFRLCERMVDQNLLSDIYIDFNFYDNPSDEFKDKGMGSLLALWKFNYPVMRGMSVTSLSWNNYYPDMFAAAFGTYEMSMRYQPGCICIYSLKCPSFPEKIISCKSGVICVEFNVGCPYLLVAGFGDGAVAVYDIRRSNSTPIAINKNNKLEHIDIVIQVRWLPDNMDGQRNFCSISADSKVVNWLLAKSELIPSEVINLRNSDPSTGVADSSETLAGSCGTSISFHPTYNDMYLIGTESGLLHKCANLSTAQYLETYRDHGNVVYSVHWNPYHPRVFLSCSADWTIKIWDHSIKESIFTFDLLNEVKDVTWAPFSSTLFAAVTNDSKVHIFDIQMNRQQPTSTYSIHRAKKNINLTSVQFNPIKPVIIVGDDRGSVISFKLSPNLRSSLKAFETMDQDKFVEMERDKMDKILKLAKNPDNEDS